MRIGCVCKYDRLFCTVEIVFLYVARIYIVYMGCCLQNVEMSPFSQTQQNNFTLQLWSSNIKKYITKKKQQQNLKISQEIYGSVTTMYNVEALLNRMYCRDYRLGYILFFWN